MAYKDKDKQREANKKAMQRLRAKNAGSALSGSGTVSQNAPGLPVADEVSDTLPVIPSKSVIPVIPKPGKDIKLAFNNGEQSRRLDSSDTLRTEAESLQHKSGTDTMSVKPYQMTVMERLFYRPANKLGRGDTNFVSLPGRACYGVV